METETEGHTADDSSLNYFYANTRVLGCHCGVRSRWPGWACGLVRECEAGQVGSRGPGTGGWGEQSAMAGDEGVAQSPHSKGRLAEGRWAVLGVGTAQ